QQPDRIDAPGKKPEALEAVEVTGLFDEGSVAIKKDGALHVWLSLRLRTDSLPRQLLQHGIDDARRVDAGHAAMIDRALAQKARTAEYVMRQDGVCSRHPHPRQRRAVA